MVTSDAATSKQSVYVQGECDSVFSGMSTLTFAPSAAPADYDNHN
jgi:hypothetical protein